MLYIVNFNLKENNLKEYKKFVKENEKTLAEHAPKGWKYLGIYFYVLGFGLYHCAVLWEISDYADFDTFRNHDDQVYWKWTEKSMGYATNEPVQSWLLREVGDTKITEPEKNP